MPTPTMVARMVVPTRHAALPDVRCDLVWVEGKLLLSGPMTSCRSSFPGKRVTLVSLEPLVASAWLNTPLHDLTDRMIPLADIKPYWVERLSEAFFKDEIEARSGLLSGTAGWIPDARLAVAVSRLRQGFSVASAASALSLTPRHLGRLFLDQLGLRPQQFARIVRLRRAILQIKRGASFAAAASSAGFADQSHFTREVGAFSGRSPGSLIPHVANVQDGVRGSPLD